MNRRFSSRNLETVAVECSPTSYREVKATRCYLLYVERIKELRSSHYEFDGPSHARLPGSTAICLFSGNDAYTGYFMELLENLDNESVLLFSHILHLDRSQLGTRR